MTIGSSAQIMAEGDVNLYAGMDALGIPGVLCTVARTDLFNQTPFAIETNPTAEAKVTQNNLITTAAGSSIKSVGHISLLTTKGTVIADGIGIGKDLSLQFAEDVAKAFGAGNISLEIRTGTSRRNSLTGVEVDGDVHSGIRNKQRLVIGYNSSDKSIQILEQTDGIAYETSTENIVANMFTRLRELEDLVAQYDPDSTVAQACRIEINYIKQELLSLGYAEKKIVEGKEEIYPIRYVEAPFITVHDTVARSGKVTVSADYLAGSGSLRAPRDAEISIINQSPWFLRVQRLTVDADGGFVYFNNRPVTSSSDINDMNVAGSPIANLTLDSGGSGGTTPIIEILNSYESPPGQSSAPPDMELIGDIINTAGTVTISNKEGSIKMYGVGGVAPAIIAHTIHLTAGRDIVQSYYDGFRHIGGDPQDCNEDAQRNYEASGRNDSNNDLDWDATGSIVAGRNVLISARYLNINGKIQSGIPEWGITLEGDDEYYDMGWRWVENPDWVETGRPHEWEGDKWEYKRVVLSLEEYLDYLRDEWIAAGRPSVTDLRSIPALGPFAGGDVPI